MSWKSAAGPALTPFAIALAMGLLFAPIKQKRNDFEPISTHYSLKVYNLSAEEINRRTLKAAAAIKAATR
jgi:hypothetical protein